MGIGRHWALLGTNMDWGPEATRAQWWVACTSRPIVYFYQAPVSSRHQWASLGSGHQASLPVTGLQWAAGATRHPCQTLGTSGQHQAPIQFLVGPFITERICFPNFTLLGLGVGLGIDEPVSESVHDSSFI